jgi:hypothetical protein
MCLSMRSLFWKKDWTDGGGGGGFVESRTPRFGRSLLNKCVNLLLIELTVFPTYGISTYILFFSISLVVVFVVASSESEFVSSFFVGRLFKPIPI